jgi:hypothetical protein
MCADPDPREFDRIPLDNEFLVLDADSSQQRAIAAVLADQSRVIHGPPGTGKSQTITNRLRAWPPRDAAYCLSPKRRRPSKSLSAVWRRLASDISQLIYTEPISLPRRSCCKSRTLWKLVRSSYR